MQSVFIPPSNEIRRVGVLKTVDSWAVGEMLCLKLLPHFSCHLNETCYTWSLCHAN